MFKELENVMESLKSQPLLLCQGPWHPKPHYGFSVSATDFAALLDEENGSSISTSSELFESVEDEASAEVKVKNTLMKCAAAMRLKQHGNALLAKAHVYQAKNVMMQRLALKNADDEKFILKQFSIFEHLADASDDMFYGFSSTFFNDLCN